MTAAPEVVIHRTPDELAQAVAVRLITRIANIQGTGRVPSVVLTGGSIAMKVYAAVARSPAQDGVDWSRVEFWFGDERFVPSDSPDRNAGQAAEAMLDHLPVDPARVHAMPSSDAEFGDDVDKAAAAYAEQLRLAVGDDAATPFFDVLLLGVGPDGHCASLFPGRPEMYDERPAVGVRDSPKAPPVRITLTLEPLRRAREVWWVVAGQDKARVVAAAISGAAPDDVPAAGPRGISRTVWMLDEAAAAELARLT